MSVLICRPVCRRSHPDKILRWIAHLEQKRQRHTGNPAAIEVIDQCIAQARSWVRGAA